MARRSSPGPSAVAVLRTVREIYGDRARLRENVVTDDGAPREERPLSFDVEGGRIYAWAEIDRGREMVVISRYRPDRG